MRILTREAEKAEGAGKGRDTKYMDGTRAPIDYNERACNALLVSRSTRGVSVGHWAATRH